MAQLTINTGSSAGAGDGDSLYTAFNKVNTNFTELYSKVTVLENGTIAVQGAVKGTVVGDDSTILVDGVSSSINLDGTVKGNIIPDADEAYDIGSSSKRFKDLYLKGTTINLGGQTISATGSGISTSGTTISVGSSTITSTASGGISLPSGSTIPGVTVTKFKPQSIRDDRLSVGATFYNDGDPVVPGSVIIDQATYLNATGTPNPDFKPSVYSAVIDPSGNISDISIDIAKYYPLGQSYDVINTDNMIAIDAGIDINDTSAVASSSQVVVLTAGINSVETSVPATSSSSISYLTTVNSSGTSPGNAPEVAITDDVNFERVIVTNNSGVAQRISVPSITSPGKIISIEGLNGTQNDIDVDAYGRQGYYNVETLTAFNVVVLLWTGGDWVNIG